MSILQLQLKSKEKSGNVRDNYYYFVSAVVIGNGFGAKPWRNALDVVGSCGGAICR
jgi:hypothetical protein